MLSCYVTGATYDRRKLDLLSMAKRYSGTSRDHLKWLKKFEIDYHRLGHAMSDLTLDKMILTVAA